jgi:hypothetical protein
MVRKTKNSSSSASNENIDSNSSNVVEDKSLLEKAKDTVLETYHGTMAKVDEVVGNDLGKAYHTMEGSKYKAEHGATELKDNVAATWNGLQSDLSSSSSSSSAPVDVEPSLHPTHGDDKVSFSFGPEDGDTKRELGESTVFDSTNVSKSNATSLYDSFHPSSVDPVLPHPVDEQTALDYGGGMDKVPNSGGFLSSFLPTSSVPASESIIPIADLQTAEDYGGGLEPDPEFDKATTEKFLETWNHSSAPAIDTTTKKRRADWDSEENVFNKENRSVNN